MNQNITKLITKLLGHYQNNVRDVVHEKNEIIKNAQAKIDTLKASYLKKQIDPYGQSGK